MESKYEQSYKKIDYTNHFTIQECESCTFTHCNFEKVKLDAAKFIDCTFKECNLSSASMQMTALRNVTFINCKMIGIHFHSCNAFGLEITFNNCNLDYCTFTEMDLRKVNFDGCHMLEVDLSGANLSKSKITNCKLVRTAFQNTDLRECDITGSIGFQINPYENKIAKMRISRTEIEGLLNQFDLNLE